MNFWVAVPAIQIALFDPSSTPRITDLLPARNMVCAAVSLLWAAWTALEAIHMLGAIRQCECRVRGGDAICATFGVVRMIMFNQCVLAQLRSVIFQPSCIAT
jgi:hypothetical protein